MKTSPENSALSTCRRRFSAFHEDEEGIQTLEVVMIIGVSALILAVLVAAWPTIKGWWAKSMKPVMKNDDLNNPVDPLK